MIFFDTISKQTNKLHATCGYIPYLREIREHLPVWVPGHREDIVSVVCRCPKISASSATTTEFKRNEYHNSHNIHVINCFSHNSFNSICATHLGQGQLHSIPDVSISRVDDVMLEIAKSMQTKFILLIQFRNVAKVQ